MVDLSIEKRTFHAVTGNHDYWYPEAELTKLKAENEMMLEGLEFYDQALRLHWAIDLERLSEVANEILKKIDENKKEVN